MTDRLMAKNIGFFDSYRVWGGGEKWHDEMSRHMSANRHEVTIFTPSDGELHRRMLGKIRLEDIEVDKLSYLNPKAQYYFYKKFKKYNLDTLIFNSFVDVRAAAVAAKKAGVKKTVLRVGTPIAPKEKKSYLYAFKNGIDEIVGISNENLDCFYRDAPRLIEGKGTSIIPNAIDLNAFRKMDVAKEELITFGNCCRLTDQKGLMDLLEAVLILKKKGQKFKVLLAGDGEDREKLELFCTANNLSEVEFVGHVEETAEFYNRLDFLTFTSRFEGTARTILESFACQVPVISYRVSSMKEMVSDNVDGLFAEAFKVSDLADKIQMMIDMRDRLPEMGLAGRKKVENEHNREVVYGKWSNYLTTY